MRSHVLSSFLFLATVVTAQQPLRFMGRTVTVTEGSATGKTPRPASLCWEGRPRQCFTGPDYATSIPNATVVQIERGTSAILFEAAALGTSGATIHFALLRPGLGKDLEDMFLSDVTLSNQSQHIFLNEPFISQAPLFITADFVLGPDEAHYSEHRFIVSIYGLLSSSMLNSQFYYLDDRYMTVRKYLWDDKADIIGPEKSEILARLTRIKQQRSNNPKN